MAEFTPNQFMIPSGAPADEKQPGVSFDGLQVDDTTKKITLNPNAVTGADFEVKTLTTGTSLFVEASTGNVGIGTPTPDIGGFGSPHTLTIFSDEGAAITEYSSSRPDADKANMMLLILSRPDYTNKNLGGIQMLLDGNTVGNRGSRINFRTKANGSATVSNALTIESSGKIVMNSSAANGGDVEILKETAGQLALFDVSTGEIFLNLPTSAGATGSLWNDSGTVKVA